MQREREEEMLFRGQEIVEGIERFYRMTGRYPMSLKQLVDGVMWRGTRRIRFLRPSALIDPMTNEEWKAVRPGDPVLKRFVEAYLESIGQPGNPILQQFVRGGAQIKVGTGAVGGGRRTGTGSVSRGGAQVGMELPLRRQAEQAAGLGEFGAEMVEEGSLAGQTAAREVGAEAGEEGEGGGPTLGVVSKSEKKTIRVYYELDQYKDWAFVFIPSEFLPVATGEARLRALLNPVMFPSDPLSRMGAEVRGIVRPVVPPAGQMPAEGRPQVPGGRRGMPGMIPRR